MRYMKRWLLMLVCVAAVLPAFSNVNPKLVKKPSAKPERLNFRESCDNPVSPIDQRNVGMYTSAPWTRVITAMIAAVIAPYTTSGTEPS